ncbi:DinB family protein [Telmatocola sphagniphila]|jgi:hypothetical protein|uniref:DinB family protein n=1 Tax=Telmatocola sphagniphila TaxID=1123043 RepID=A0A8E6EWP4_9BACT|nr:DinB family protein [Telmatocola sphagniphila]QVL30371.1 DinB family protein [Telmatocola sphagniphila]
MIPFPELIQQYHSGIDVLRKAVSGMTREQLLAHPIPGKWSTLEVVAHISDFESILADRMKRIIALERPLLLVADENLFVTKLAYQERDLNEELELIAVTRKQMGRILNTVKPSEATNRAGVHSLKGLVTLEAVLSSAANHIPHHVPFIAEKRKALAS